VTRLQQSVTRRVTFQAKCTEGSCQLGGWTGPERSAKYAASFDLAAHNVNRHGRAERIGGDQ
jgi:hypothetical protein